MTQTWYAECVEVLGGTHIKLGRHVNPEAAARLGMITPPWSFRLQMPNPRPPLLDLTLCPPTLLKHPQKIRNILETIIKETTELRHNTRPVTPTQKFATNPTLYHTNTTLSFSRLLSPCPLQHFTTKWKFICLRALPSRHHRCPLGFLT